MSEVEIHVEFMSEVEWKIFRFIVPFLSCCWTFSLLIIIFFKSVFIFSWRDNDYSASNLDVRIHS